jgi:FkbM family methyltransferase
MRMMQTLLANVRKHKMDIGHGCRGLVYDLGMNNGDDTVHYLEQGYRVLAVEADPDLVCAARKRFQSAIENGQATILNVGISDRCGTATFWICDDNSIWNSFIKERAVRNGLRHHAIEIPVVTLPDLLDQHGTPDYLKIDVEGYEPSCVQSLAGRPLPRYISAEDNWAITDDGKPAFLVLLRDVGYRKFKLISQHDHTALPRNSPVGREASANSRSGFPEGSSGPWGEESDGKWLDFDNAVMAYFDAKELDAIQGGDFWVDWHAKA